MSHAKLHSVKLAHIGENPSSGCSAKPVITGTTSTALESPERTFQILSFVMSAVRCKHIIAFFVHPLYLNLLFSL